MMWDDDLQDVADTSLNGGDVHVWVSSLESPHEQVLKHQRLLSKDEIRRASSFRFARDRNRFVLAHGIVRSILSRYLSMAPADLAIRRADSGRPHLESTGGGEDVQFSMSHTEDRVAVAIARDMDVGVDIERIREVQRMDSILARCLSEQALLEVMAMSAEERRQAFFTWWTANEALLKAREKGMGSLSEGLDIIPENGRIIPNDSNNVSGDTTWSLSMRDVEPDYKLAVVASGEGLSFRYSKTAAQPHLTTEKS